MQLCACTSFDFAAYILFMPFGHCSYINQALSFLSTVRRNRRVSITAMAVNGADQTLDGTIQFSPLPDIKNILVTGGNGFV